MKIAIIGSGFVGQATGKGFAKHKHNITFIDTDEEKVESLKAEGQSAFLPSQYSVITTEVTMFSVPTPTKGQGIVLDHLKAAVTDFAKRLKNHKKYHLAVIRSTVPPGTTRDVLLPIIEDISGKKVGKNFGLAMQPEYLREATANEDFERPWFVLIGQYDSRSGDILEKLYKPFDAPIERASLEEAEMQKYVHNIFNAVKIAFFNEMRIAINAKGWDAQKIFYAVAESCEAIWNPIYGVRDYGPFDGSCLPKDSRALLEWGEKNEFDFGILWSVITQNIKHEKLLGVNENVRTNYLANINV